MDDDVNEKKIVESILVIGGVLSGVAIIGVILATVKGILNLFGIDIGL